MTSFTYETKIFTETFRSEADADKLREDIIMHGYHGIPARSILRVDFEENPSSPGEYQFTITYTYR